MLVQKESVNQPLLALGENRHMKGSQQVIEHLSPHDALAVLKTLARDDEALAARIAEIATAHLSKLDPEAGVSQVRTRVCE